MAIDKAMRISLDSYQYNDGVLLLPEHNKSPYYITVTKAFCKLNFSYMHPYGERLKYYQFSLYNGDVLLGVSKKMYGTTKEGIVYGVENYNNLQNYTLKLRCVTQNDNENTLVVNIYVNYEQDNVYADISFIVDKQSAENNVTINIVQLNGEGRNHTYQVEDKNEYVVIPDNGYVTFVDKYQVITDTFLCRMWCKDLSKNVPILTINTKDRSGRVEVFFDGLNFIAKKHSCNLTSPYINCIKNANDKDVVSETELKNKNIYFSMGYYNGRIEMYAKIIN